MKLHYFTAWMIFVVLLFGVATSAHSQEKRTIFGSFHGLPTRLFGSTSSCGCVDGCAQTCDNDCSPGCGQKGGCVQAPSHGPKCATVFAPAQKYYSGVAQKSVVQKSVAQKCSPVYAPAQKSCGCGVAQKSVVQKSVAQKCSPAYAPAQKSVVQKSVAQKSVAQKCFAPKTIVQKSVAQKSDSSCCDDGCKPNSVVRALSKLDGAVKGLFRRKSDCCQACPDLCCDTQNSCSQYDSKADTAYGYGHDDYDSPGDFSVPSPYNDPQSEGNPFEDDAVPPPPPAPSEASVPQRPQPLLGPVAAREVTSPFRVQTPARISFQSPARIQPVEAAPLRTTPQLAKSILDRGNSATSRQYPIAQPRYKLTSVQSEVR